MIRRNFATKTWDRRSSAVLPEAANRRRRLINRLGGGGGAFQAARGGPLSRTFDIASGQGKGFGADPKPKPFGQRTNVGSVGGAGRWVVVVGRESIGDGSLVGDTRWAGAYGVDADLVARTHCSVEFIRTEDIQVSARSLFLSLFLAFSLALALALARCSHSLNLALSLSLPLSHSLSPSPSLALSPSHSLSLSLSLSLALSSLFSLSLSSLSLSLCLSLSRFLNFSHTLSPFLARSLCSISFSFSSRDS